MNIKTIYDQLSKRKMKVQMIFTSEEHKMRVMMKSNWLAQNLSMNFNSMYSAPSSRGGSVKNITLLGNDNTGETASFSITLIPQYPDGQFTAFTPHMLGCVSQGRSKKEALENLCTALSESAILNYEYLKINPFSTTLKEMDLDIRINDATFTPVEMASFMHLDFGVDTAYISDNNIYMKPPKHPKLTLVIPLTQINCCTQMVTCTIAQTYIGGSVTMGLAGY